MIRWYNYQYSRAEMREKALRYLRRSMYNKRCACGEKFHSWWRPEHELRPCYRPDYRARQGESVNAIKKEIARCKAYCLNCLDERKFGVSVRSEPIVRFLVHITFDESGCWLWNGAVREDYGRFQHMGAHAWSCTYFHGPRPEGLICIHSCDRPPCVNPDHLSWDTYAENNRQARERHPYWRELLRLDETSNSPAETGL